MEGADSCGVLLMLSWKRGCSRIREKKSAKRLRQANIRTTRASQKIEGSWRIVLVHFALIPGIEFRRFLKGGFSVAGVAWSP